MSSVHVVGAGPAGSFAALSALKAGHDVYLSEEHERIGQPVHCSGLVSASGLKQMDDVVPYKKVIRNPIYRANLHGANSCFSLSYAQPKAYVIERGKFDFLAAQKFIDAGGKVLPGHGVRRLEDLKSRNVIGADGPISTISRLFDFPRIRAYTSCWQGDFSYRCIDTGAVEVFFDPRLCPGFIGWIIPTSEETAEIGLGVASAKGLHAARNQFLSKLGIQEKKPESEFSALIPLSVRKKTAGIFGSGANPAALARAGPSGSGRAYHVCLAGDAAGQVKASSGGGIFFGSSCGRLAGQLFEHPDEYEKAWRSKYGLDLALHGLLRRGLNSLPSFGVDLWLASMKALRFDWLLAESGEMDEYSKMLSARTLGAWARAWTRQSRKKD